MVRQAKIHDVPEIVNLINSYAQHGEMLGRSQVQIYNALRDFVVIENDGHVVGVGSLSIIWKNLAEIRSLAVAPEFKGKGLGRQIVEHLVNDAKKLDLPIVFTLTYQPDFFKKLGFIWVDKKELPHKVWKDCINCPKFPDCDETALIRYLDEEAKETGLSIG